MKKKNNGKAEWKNFVVVYYPKMRAALRGGKTGKLFSSLCQNGYTFVIIKGWNHPRGLPCVFCLLAYPKAGIRRSSIRRLCPFEGSFAKGGFLPSCFPPNMFQLFSSRAQRTRKPEREDEWWVRERPEQILKGVRKGVREFEKEKHKNLDII